MITDITKLKNLEQLRKEFVGNISHELRTPLTVMRGYIETLQDLPNNTATVETAFDQMSEQITRMQALADDLIMISRLEADNREPVLEAVNISDLLRDIVSEAQDLVMVNIASLWTAKSRLWCRPRPVIFAVP